MALDYKSAGVNIELGDEASKILYEAAKATWANRKGKFGEIVEPFSDFSGIRGFLAKGLPENTIMNIDFDGVGTKMEVAERLGRHNTIGYDLTAMAAEDAEVRGAEPILMGTVLDVKSLGKEDEYLYLIRELGYGLIGAAKEANIAVINGETAELPGRVDGYTVAPGFWSRLQKSITYLVRGDFTHDDGFNYNWCAGVLWAVNKNRMGLGQMGFHLQKG
jgi:phosphoribosylformylglycinamidine cyclo-ligase